MHVISVVVPVLESTSISGQGKAYGDIRRSSVHLAAVLPRPSLWPSPRQTQGPPCPYPSDRTPPVATMKPVAPLGMIQPLGSRGKLDAIIVRIDRTNEVKDRPTDRSLTHGIVVRADEAGAATDGTGRRPSLRMREGPCDGLVFLHLHRFVLG